MLLSFGAYTYFSKTSQDDIIVVHPDVVKTIDKQLAQLDDATIEKYLQENESITEINAGWYKQTQGYKIEDLLQDFSEQELQQLLENPDLTTGTKEKKP